MPGGALIQRPVYLQAGHSLLSAPLAARWQRKLLMRWRATTISIG
jgi:hypothetical protein